MVSITNEQALEATIEKALTGRTLEELNPTSTHNIVSSHPEIYRSGKGFHIGYPEDFNKKYALDEKRLWHFLETTQPEEIEKLKRQPN